MYKLIELPKIPDPRGNLTFLQNGSNLPFTIKRVFWTYDVPGGEIRGGHAFKNQEQLIIALSGSFEVVFTARNGTREKVLLNRSYYGLYIPPLAWRHMENFSTNALSLHLASTIYDASDYLYDFEEFKNFKDV